VSTSELLQHMKVFGHFILIEDLNRLFWLLILSFIISLEKGITDTENKIPKEDYLKTFNKRLEQMEH
jgi:hypothetical protein